MSSPKHVRRSAWPNRPTSNRSCSIDSQTPTAAPIIDAHNDTLLNLLTPERGGGRDFFQLDERGHVDLPRARLGGLAGGFFAMFAPSAGPNKELIFKPDGYEVVLADRLAASAAERLTFSMLELLQDLARCSGGEFLIATDLSSIERAMSDGALFAVPHIEGAEVIAPDLSNLEPLYRSGIRSLGITWSRANAFGSGVPYAFPRSPDVGPGLTGPGRELVRACNRLGIMLDASHLNYAGFKDLAATSDAPLVATHSCVHRICQVTRNLTDWQIDAIGEASGVVGIAFDVSMLRPDGALDVDTALDVIVDHIDYIAERAGIDHVALGSDFDGAVMPRSLPDVAGLPALIEALRCRGYDADAIARITHRNWLRVLAATWRE